jgi:hypothetical protein
MQKKTTELAGADGVLKGCSWPILLKNSFLLEFRSNLVKTRYLTHCFYLAAFPQKHPNLQEMEFFNRIGRFQPVTPLKITLVERLLCAQEQPVA